MTTPVRPEAPTGVDPTPAGAARRRRRADPTRPPAAVVAVGATAVLLLALPLVGLLQQASWSTLGADLTSPAALDALRLSLGVSLAAAGLSVALGLPLAWLLARVPFPGRRLVRALVTLPLVLPPVVGGVALLSAFGPDGLAGGLLGDLGARLTFTTAGAVVAATFVALPFFVLAAEAGLRGLDPRHEAVAATLGAGRWLRLRRVTLPLLAPSMVAGTVLAWARALGEFGATLTFAGSIQGETRTLPLATYLALESDPEVAVALSLALLAVAAVALVALRDRWWTVG